MRTIDAIARRLQDQGVGTEGVTIFAGSDVTLPSEAGLHFITLAETPGRPPIGIHNSTSLRQPGIQVTARGDIYPTVGALAESALIALGGEEGLSNILIGDVFFLSLRPTGEIHQLPNDAKGRVRLAFNLNSTRR